MSFQQQGPFLLKGTVHTLGEATVTLLTLASPPYLHQGTPAGSLKINPLLTLGVFCLVSLFRDSSSDSVHRLEPEQAGSNSSLGPRRDRPGSRLLLQSRGHAGVSGAGARAGHVHAGNLCFHSQVGFLTSVVNATGAGNAGPTARLHFPPTQPSRGRGHVPWSAHVSGEGADGHHLRPGR